MSYHSLLLPILWDKCQHNTAKASCFWCQQELTALGKQVGLPHVWHQLGTGPPLRATTNEPYQSSNLCNFISFPKVLFLLHLSLKPWLCFSPWGDLVPTCICSWLHPHVFPPSCFPIRVSTGTLRLSLMLQTIWYRQHQSASLRQGLIINSGIFQILTHFSLNNPILLLLHTKLVLLHHLQYFKSDLAAPKISHM